MPPSFSSSSDLRDPPLSPLSSENNRRYRRPQAGSLNSTESTSADDSIRSLHLSTRLGQRTQILMRVLACFLGQALVTDITAAFTSTMQPLRRHSRGVLNTAVYDSTEMLPSDTVQRFISSWQSAVKGDVEPIRRVMASEAKWDSPIGSTAEDIRKGFQLYSSFFLEPALTVFSTKNTNGNIYEIEYQLSFWYPMPWRPRIIIPGRARIEISPENRMVTSVEERWTVSLADVFLRQFPPRFWDLWNSFSTPAPEYPPIKELARVGRVTFSELPQTVAIELRWSGAAKYPGPPLLTLPGFGLFGDLRTSRPNRDQLFTVLPVEVQSARFFTPERDEEMKQTSWILHVPTSLQTKVLDLAISGKVFPISDNRDEVEEEDDLVDQTDYVVGLENVNIMKSATGGILRANVPLNATVIRDFEAKERKEYLYRILPRRLVAEVGITGEATPEKISAALSELKETVVRDAERVIGRRVMMRQRDLGSKPQLGGSPQLGLQLWGCKACFNARGEPAMGVYELQYGSRLTKVFVELTVD